MRGTPIVVAAAHARTRTGNASRRPPVHRMPDGAVPRRFRARIPPMRLEPCRFALHSPPFITSSREIVGVRAVWACPDPHPRPPQLSPPMGGASGRSARNAVLASPTSRKPEQAAAHGASRRRPRPAPPPGAPTTRSTVVRRDRAMPALPTRTPSGSAAHSAHTFRCDPDRRGSGSPSRRDHGGKQ
jgi:hypothetical protein